MDLTDQRIVVTGGAGFFGSHVVDELERRGCDEILVPRSAEHDLTDPDAVEAMYEEMEPDVLIHLAAAVGGIGANESNPARFFHDNALMGLQVVDAARRHALGKLVIIGSVCAYPRDIPTPFREEDLWEGYPAKVTAPYGLAKRLLLVEAKTYRKQYGLDAIYLMPTNLYGPRDDFDLETSHVIPAIMRKCLEAQDAGEDTVHLWGTGKATRDFLYVEDGARAVVQATASYERAEPLNLGTGREVSIRELAETIRKVTGFDGRFDWDTSRPVGQPRRVLDTSRADRRLDWEPRISLEEGLERTLRWFEEHRDEID